MNEMMSRVGQRLGHWNDQHFPHDERSEAPRRWRAIDRIAGWLYVRGDRA